MGKKEIKKGDFVRMKHYPFEGQICQITEIPKEGMYLTDRCSLCTDAHFEPIDPKTAFLNDLSELLRKYDVFLIAHDTDMPISAYFNNSKDYDQFATIGKEKNKGCGVIIEPDTIINNNLL